MANTLYDEARRLFLEAGINWLSDDIKAILIDADSYSPNFSDHKYLSDISTSARVTSGVLLTGKETEGGAADANDVTFSSVSGPTVEAVVLYVDTGSESTSTLIAWLDTATGLPITPNGGDIIVTWDDGTNKIFRL